MSSVKERIKRLTEPEEIETEEPEEIEEEEFDEEDDEEPEMEFETITVEAGADSDADELESVITSHLEGGWLLDSNIVVGSRVTLVFSREKE